MGWRETADKYFPPEPQGRASVPTRPSFEQSGEVGTPDTLARLTVSEPDAHVSDWYDRQERAAILEFDAGLERREAERRAGLWV